MQQIKVRFTAALLEGLLGEGYRVPSGTILNGLPSGTHFVRCEAEPHACVLIFENATFPHAPSPSDVPLLVPVFRADAEPWSGEDRRSGKERRGSR